MPKTYSLYETKARLSAIIRQVRGGQRVTVTVHGKPVAEIRPLPSDRTGTAARLAGFDELVSANLLEAELRAAFRRENVAGFEALPAPVSWIVPDRPLSTEIVRVLATGSVRRADCWHLATALYLAEDPAQIAFLTLDARQKEVAQVLGFET